MSIVLKKHNQETYEKIKEYFRKVNRVAVIHPTGTGKSYLALKLLEENKEKKAIYVAPSIAILHNVKKNIFKSNMSMKDFSNLKRITYAKLAQMTDEEIEMLGADIIILDEFHHCGAPEWGNGVQRLLGRNHQAQVLGLSATPIRYFDKARDMAEELFKGNIASEMSLEEAIERGILPEATYVSSLYAYNEELNTIQKNINLISNSKRREKAQLLYNSLKNKLDENTENLPSLLSKYMVNKDGKYIVFCKSIEDMKEKMMQAQEIFGGVNSNIKTYSVSSKQNLAENDRTLTEFEDDKEPGSLKLLFSVNMLNEGYHLHDLDGVIMMRPTFSPTIFAQQLGRALSLKREGGNKPVIIDLVNNFDSCKIIQEFCERIQSRRKGKNNNTDNNKSIKLSIFDKTKEFREIAGKIAELCKRKMISLDEKIEIFERYFEMTEGTDDELNGQTVFEGYPIGEWTIQLRNQLKNTDRIFTEEQREKLDKLGILEYDSGRIKIDDKIDALIEWNRKYPDAGLYKSFPEIDDALLRYARKMVSKASPQINNSEREKVAYLECSKLMDEYDRIKEFYTYLKIRKKRGVLTPEQEERCREGKIRGVFGYPRYVEEFSKKYNADLEQIMKVCDSYESQEEFEQEVEGLSQKYKISTNKIIYILSRYQSMYNFFKVYLFGKNIAKGLNFSDQEVLRENIATRIDINLREYPNLQKILDAIYLGDNKFLGTRLGQIYDGASFIEIMNRVLDGRRKVSLDIYGVDNGKLKTPNELAEMHGIGKKAIREQLNKDILMLRTAAESYTVAKIPDIDMLSNDEIKEMINLLGTAAIKPDSDFEQPPIDIKIENVKKAVEMIRTIEKGFEWTKRKYLYIPIEKLDLPYNLRCHLKANQINYVHNSGFGLYKARLYEWDKQLITQRIEKYLVQKRIERTEEIKNSKGRISFEEGFDEYDVDDNTPISQILPRAIRYHFERINSNDDQEEWTIGRLETFMKVTKYCLVERIDDAERKEIIDILKKYHRWEENEEGKAPEIKTQDDSKSTSVYSQNNNITRDTLISTFGLSTRAYNCLVRSKIRTLGELESKINSEFGLSRIRNLGVKTEREILDLFEKYKDKLEPQSQSARQELEEKLTSCIEQDRDLTETIEKAERLIDSRNLMDTQTTSLNDENQ